MIEIYALSYNGQPASAEMRGVFGADGGTFGRGNDNRLPLPDPARHVSRVQGRIRWDGARFWIANVSEANPMFLNDEEIESNMERPLAAGDELRVGLYVLRVRDAEGAAVDYRPPAAPARPAPLPGAPAGGGSIDALLGGAPAAGNPFADILGGAVAAPPVTGLAPAAPAPRAPAAPMADVATAPPPDLGLPRPSPQGTAPPDGNPFADLLGPGAAAGLPAAPPAASAAQPFADLLGGNAAAGSAPSPAPSSQAFAEGGIPSDFDPFAIQAKPAARNSDDPLRDLASAGIDLAAVGNEPPKSLVDFDPARKADPDDAMRGGTPSLVDPLHAVDPMQLFGGAPDPLQGISGDVMPRDALPMNDSVPLIDAYYAPARVVRDPGLPPLAPEAKAPAAPIPARPTPEPTIPADAFAAPPAAPPVAEVRPAAVAVRAPAAPPASPAMPATPPSVAAEPSVRPTPATPAATPPARPAPRGTPAITPRAAADVPPPSDATADALIAAFLEGAHAPGLHLPNGLTPAAMRDLGALVYQAVAGAMALIAARQITKREIGAELTMIVATRNNPLKFLPTPEAAMMQILGPRMPGFMAATDAMADAFDDLRAHEVGVIAGTRAAFAEVLRRFDPRLLEERLGSGSFMASLLPGARRAQLWQLFTSRYNELYRDAQDDFDSLYGLAFTQAYEEEVARNRQTQKQD